MASKLEGKLHPIYRGDVKGPQAIRHGKGTLKYPDAGGKLFTYNGDWKDGRKIHGTFQIDGLSEYEGDFQGGEITGIGKRIWKDGRMYYGELVNGEMNGKGSFIDSNGDTYEGDFVDNKREGVGVLTRGFNGCAHIYSGSFKSHKFHGLGKYVSTNNFFLEGCFDRGVMEGQCTLSWHKTAKFEGNMRDGRMNGRGHYLALDNSYEYEGYWLEGRPEYGTMLSVSATLDRSALAPVIDPAVKDKKAPPPKKGAPVDPEFAGVMNPGDFLGALDVIAELSAAPTGVGSIWTNELRRRLSVQLLDTSQIPTSLWLRIETIHEQVVALERIPSALHRIIASSSLISGDVTVIPEHLSVLEVYKTTGDGVDGGLSISYSNASSLERRGDLSMSYLVDFALDLSEVVFSEPYCRVEIFKIEEDFFARSLSFNIDIPVSNIDLIHSSVSCKVIYSYPNNECDSCWLKNGILKVTIRDLVGFTDREEPCFLSFSLVSETVKTGSLLSNECKSFSVELPWSNNSVEPFQLKCSLQRANDKTIEDLPPVDISSFDFTSGIPMIVKMPFASLSGQVTLDILFDVTDPSSKEDLQSEIVWQLDGLIIDLTTWHSIALQIFSSKELNVSIDGMLYFGSTLSEVGAKYSFDWFLARQNKNVDSVLKIVHNKVPKYIKTLAVATHLDHLDAVSATKCFIGHQVLPCLDAYDENVVPSGFYPSFNCNIFCCSGKAKLLADRVRLPTSIVPGVYTIEISDATNQCILLPDEDDKGRISQSDSLNPNNAGTLVRAIRKIDSFTRLKVNIVAKV